MLGCEQTSDMLEHEHSMCYVLIQVTVFLFANSLIRLYLICILELYDSKTCVL